jgi:NAD(P)H-hydrate epimerase
VAKQPIPDTYEGLPVVTAEEMQAIDRKAIHELHIASTFLMERAGQGVASETERFAVEKLGKPVAGLLVAVCCGRGNNGGDGLVAARVLKEKGASVRASIIAPKQERGYPAEVTENLLKAKAAGVEVTQIDDASQLPADFLSGADVLLDGLLGTGAAGKPAGLVKDLIQAMFKSNKPVIAIDLPSGIHPDTGYHTGVFLNAAVTVTLGLPKKGLLAAHAQKHVGDLRVVDIGYPSEILPKK